jgi:poly(A) polymerase
MTTPTEANHVLTTLSNAGHASFFVGGCVRDSLLGRDVHDWDVTTSATPEQVEVLFPGATKFVGANFGVSLVRVGNVDVEVATFRTDGAYTDNRRPDSVKFTLDVNEDLARRDFTCNALLMNRNGTVLDYVGGQDDMRHKVLRTVGDPMERFTEDALRMLRLVRFAAQLDFTVDNDTALAVRKLAQTVTSVPAERVNVELSKMLTSGNANLAMWLMDELGLLDYVLPDFLAMHRTEQNPDHHPEGNVWNHTMLLLERLPKNCSLTLALAALFHDVGKVGTCKFSEKTGHNTFHGHAEFGAVLAGQILRRMKFANEVVDVVVSHTAQHMKFFEVEKMKRSTLARFVRQDNFAELLELHRLDCVASNGDLSSHKFVVDFLGEVPACKLSPNRLLTGDDLVAMGFKPGPQFKMLLESVETAQLEGQVHTKQEAVALVYSLVS